MIYARRACPNRFQTELKVPIFAVYQRLHHHSKICDYSNYVLLEAVKNLEYHQPQLLRLNLMFLKTNISQIGNEKAHNNVLYQDSI